MVYTLYALPNVFKYFIKISAGYQLPSTGEHENLPVQDEIVRIEFLVTNWAKKRRPLFHAREPRECIETLYMSACHRSGWRSNTLGTYLNKEILGQIKWCA